MYWMEWVAYVLRSRPKPGIILDSIIQHITVKDAPGDGQQVTDVRQRRSDTIDDHHAIYRHTNTYIDVCTYNDDKRGLISLVLGVMYWGVGGLWLGDALTDSVPAIWSWKKVNGEAIDAEMIFVMLVDFTVFPAVLYVLLRFGFPLWRLEAFTLRRLVVRFNRKTRKVYLLRPPYLGGVAVHDWEQVEAGLPGVDDEGDTAGAAGGFLILGWMLERNDNPYAGTTTAVDAAFLGGPCDDYAQLLGFWEYIRRFMEEGPQAAPRPRRLRTRWPNPVSSLLTVFRLNLPGGIGKLPFFRVLRVIMFPAFFIWMLGHQLSQLLSYEGRFPKAIRRVSGESELGSLLALIGYNLLPLLYTPLWVWPLFAWLDNQDPWLPWHWLRSWL
ncbi:DUF6708 domain-containing protein [Chromobacterium aquaticum]|uniref:DUF6708 domain-containing protein n=1 Tax=Chromobacterium aquaticum TaxID=467180 RepID=A0ABV8ZWI9_9NEIS|nr:DUF6708 domain-containing protein [Chromobacterium aquaticum]MCD5360608.1 hypothetical protein [Chromobacterium aquaticum]